MNWSWIAITSWVVSWFVPIIKGNDLELGYDGFFLVIKILPGMLMEIEKIDIGSVLMVLSGLSNFFFLFAIGLEIKRKPLSLYRMTSPLLILMGLLHLIWLLTYREALLIGYYLWMLPFFILGFQLKTWRLDLKTSCFFPPSLGADGKERNSALIRGFSNGLLVVLLLVSAVPFIEGLKSSREDAEAAQQPQPNVDRRIDVIADELSYLIGQGSAPQGLISFGKVSRVTYTKNWRNVQFTVLYSSNFGAKTLLFGTKNIQQVSINSKNGKAVVQMNAYPLYFGFGISWGSTNKGKKYGVIDLVEFGNYENARKVKALLLEIKGLSQ